MINKKRINLFIVILIVIIFFTDPGVLFLRLIDISSLNIEGAFKILDILAAIFLFLFIFSKKYKEKILDDKLRFMKIFFRNIFIFWIIYMLYTILFTQTADFLGALKYSRGILYLVYFFLFAYYFKSKSLFDLFWKIFIICIYISFVVYILSLIFQKEFTIENVTSFEFKPLPRIYFNHYFLIFFMFFTGMIQKILKYNGKYKINNKIIAFSLILLIMALSRNLWITLIISYALIFIIGKVYKISNIQNLNRNFKISVFVIVILAISYILLSSYDFINVFSSRVENASLDLNTGKGTFSGRMDAFDYLHRVMIKNGYQYTGLGYPHHSSPFIQGTFSTYFNYSGGWAVESFIFQNIVQYGYIGTAIFYILILIFLHKFLKFIRVESNPFILSFGFSLWITTFASVFVNGFSGGGFSFFLFPILFGMFVGIKTIFNNEG